MSNLATLRPAPPFTPDNAVEMARRSVEVRRLKRDARIAALQKLSERPKIEPEIGRIVRAMAKLPVTSDDYARLAAILDKLWSKAFPTQAAVKSKGPRERQQSSSPLSETPQEPPAVS